jgi:SAM-dependent methyltransferase
MVAEVSCEALPAAEKYRIICQELWLGLRGLLARRLERNREQVSAEYDSGSWKAVLEQKSWEQCTSLRDYLVPGDERLRVAKIKDRLVRIKTSDYYDYRLRTLQDVLAEYAGSESELIELGCGYGANLFSLSLAGRWRSLSGFDISENGIQAAREAARHFNLPAVSFDRLDITDRGDPNYRRIKDKTVYTYYCLEQLKYSTPTVIENIIRAGARRIIHIEPTFELLRMWHPVDLTTYFYVKKQDYQDNLVTTLKNFEKRGLIKILDLKRLYYAPTYRNDPTLICWEPSASAQDALSPEGADS